MKKIPLFLFFFLIQFNLSIKEEVKKIIKFKYSLGEPQCLDYAYAFDFAVETEGFEPEETHSISFFFSEPKYCMYICELSPDTNFKIFNCYVPIDLYPLVDQKIEFMKNISVFKPLEIYDWDKIVGENAILSEKANCFGRYSYEFIPNKKIPVKHNCLPDNYHEMIIKGFFTDNNEANTLKSREINNFHIFLYINNSYLNISYCNITVHNNEKNNIDYESEMVCNFRGYNKAYIFPTKAEDIYFHDFQEYDLSCENSANLLYFNKLYLFLILLFFCLLLDIKI